MVHLFEPQPIGLLGSAKAHWFRGSRFWFADTIHTKRASLQADEKTLAQPGSGHQEVGQCMNAAMRLWLSKPMGSHFGVGGFTTHCRTYFSGDWDVFLGGKGF